MKKRFAVLALCLVFTGTLIAVPKARASLVGAGAAAVGAAVLATYMAASGLTINTDSAETITTGLDSLAEDYLTDTGSTETAESWLSTIAGLVTIPGAGVLQLPASVVRIIGSFTTWLTETFGLTEEGSEAIPVPSPTGFCSYNGVELPNIDTVWTDKVTYPYAWIDDNSIGYYFSFSDNYFYHKGSNKAVLVSESVTYVTYFVSKSSLDSWAYNSSNSIPSITSTFKKLDRVLWTNFDVLNSDGSVFFAASNPIAVGQFALTRGENYTDIAAEADDSSVNIFVPQTITNPDDLPVVVPELIINRELAPTYELTQEGAGEGTDTEDGTGADDTTVGLLQSILQGVKSIGDTFTDSLTDAFTPSQEAVDSLAAEVDAKLPIIPTLQNFGSDLVYKLEHPESCANGLGLTTVVDLKKGRGTYLGNTAHNLLDVSWYLEYKPLVDDIIVGFCWLGFLWNCYGALPRIIHGEGAIAGAITVLRKEDTGDDR